MISVIVGLTISGRVIDSESGRPMAYAVVILYSSIDTSKITGTYTDEKGTFALKKVKPGEYLLSADFVGYRKEWIGPFTLKGDTNLGEISLKPQPIRTEEVVVEATPRKVRYEVDRKVITPSADIVGQGGSAADVLRGVPGVQVDPQGNVKVRGNDRYVLFVDGHPTNLTLKDIPASQIERIEVITNPSAEYDAEGNAIINVVMKRRRALGYGLNVQGAATSYAGGMLNAMVGVNTGRFQPYVRLRLTRWVDKSVAYGKSVFTNDTAIVLSDDVRITSSITGGEVGFRYMPTGRDEVNLEVGGRYRKPTFSYPYRYVLNGDTSENMGAFRLTSPDGHLLLGYDHTFSEGHTISITLYGYHNPFTLITEDSAPDGHIYTKTVGKALYGFAEVRYRRKIGRFHISAGYKGEADLYDYTYNIDVTTPTFPDLGNFAFEGRDWTHALYTTLASNSGKLSYKAGLRLEYMDRVFKILPEGRAERVRYFAPFPTLHLSYPYGKGNELYFSISRRVWRPYGDHFLPVKIPEGRTEIQEGNPQVLPEYSNALEVGADLSLGPLSITPEIYASKRDNIFDVEEHPYGDGYPVTVKRFINAGSGYDLGGSLYVEGSLLRGMLRFNLTPFYTAYSYSNLTSSRYGTSASLTLSALIGMLQVRMDYTAPRDAVWGRYGQELYTQIAFMTQIKRFSLVLSFSDPFRLYRYEIEVKGKDYYVHKYNAVSWPNVSLSVRYNFSRDFRPPQERETSIENTGERLLR